MSATRSAEKGGIGTRFSPTIESMAADDSGTASLAVRVRGRVWPDYQIGALLFLLALLPYANTLTAGFVYDDFPQLVDNPYILNFGHLREIFLSNVWSFQGAQGTTNYYRPLMTFGYLLCYQVFGLLPFGFHLASILLNAAVVCLLFFLTRRLFASVSVGLVAAVLFALHPIHTESVAWIAGVTDVELTLFYLLTFWAYARFGDVAPRQAPLRYALPLAGFVLALLSKEPALTLPVLATFYEHYLREGRNTTSFRVKVGRYAPLWGLAAFYLAFRVLFLGALAPILHRSELTPSAALFSALSLISSYVGKLIWPVQLSAFYVFQQTDTWRQPSALAGLALLAAACVAFGVFWKRARACSLAILWLLVTLAPVLNARWMAANVFAERYLYLPSVGFCWLAAYGVVQLWKAAQARPRRWRQALAAAGAAIALLLALRTVVRNDDWKDDLTLYTETLRVSPQAHLIRTNLGTVYWRQGDAASAEREWREVIGRSPSNVVTLNNLGLLCKEQQRFAEAVEHLSRAIALKPTYANAHINLGLTYEAMGQPEWALAELRTAATLAPLNAEARYQLGRVLSIAGQLEEAGKHFLASIEAGPTAAAHSSLAEILLRNGYRDQGEWHLREALAINPFDAQSHLRLGRLLQETGRPAEAARAFEAVLSLDPRNPQARLALGMQAAEGSGSTNAHP